MSWPSRFAARFRSLFGRRRLDFELDEELRFHLEMQTEDNLRAGMPADQARLAALRSFGGAAVVKETYRDVRSFAGLESVARDLGYAVRSLRKSTGFATAAVLSLALGIGANTAIFNLIDALLLRELPVREPARLVQLTVPRGQEMTVETFSYPLVEALATHGEVFSGVAGFSTISFKTGNPDAAEEVQAAWVTGGYYQMLGLEPVAGRLILPADDRPGATPVAVIADAYWARRFGRDAGVIGKALRIESADVVVVGVSPPGFTGLDAAHVADITVTAGALPQILPGIGSLYVRPNYLMLRVLARPRADSTTAQAKSGLAAIWPGVIAGSPFAPMLSFKPDLVPGGTGWTDLRKQFERPLLVLMGAVSLLLLIACANVANLLLARSSARQRELALRVAIGASRGRIARQLLTESGLLSIAGALLGIGLAWLGSQLLVNLIGSGPVQHISLDVGLHRHVFLFVTGTAVLTTLLFGVAPAWRATQAGLSAALKNQSAQLTGSRKRLAPVLVVLQVGLSLLLLIGAGLFLGTLRNLRSFDAGFRHDGVLFVDVDPPPGAGPLAGFYAGLLDQVSHFPGVVSVSLSNSTIFSGGAVRYAVSVAGSSATPESVDFDRVGPRYFETLRTPLVGGREFTMRDDRTAPPVAIVNQALARHFFPDGNAVGQRLAIEGGGAAAAEIVGVVGDTRSESLREPAKPAVFVPFFQRRETLTATLEVHAGGSLALVVAELRREIQPFAKRPIQIRALTAQVEKSLVEERLVATLASAFGCLALLLACVGLYGLLAYAVAQRTREIGIRMALGAQRALMLRAQLGAALRLLVMGTGLGLPAAWLAARWISSLLFGLTPTDPLTIAGAAAVLTGAGLLAALLPALRASRVDPAVALRHE